MKLSYKFFCIAYIIVLLATGLGGSYLIRNINSTLWNTQIDKVNTAVNYASDSFLALADISYDKISGGNKAYMINQLKSVTDNSISEIDIFTEKNAPEEYKNIAESQCAQTFREDDGRTVMKSVCRLSVGSDTYFLEAYSDFTETAKQCNLFWRWYGIAVFVISAISGLILFLAALKITNPLKSLTKIADEIALGNYGIKADIKTNDYEISALSESVNAMSAAIEQKIAEINAELEKRDMFVADFTHEMKTPMTSIMGYSQMLRSYNLAEKEKEQAADAIYSEAKRLEKLSLQLLELYVYKNEEIETEKQSLREIEKQLKLTLLPLSQKYGVGFTTDFADETAQVNTVLLLSMLYNLADNAFKASTPENPIKIYTTTLPDSIKISVEDKGTGIEKEHIKLLTEPFYREDKSRARTLGGAGLGLSLCKETARLHGSELIIESEKGKGTTVSFTLKRVGENND